MIRPFNSPFLHRSLQTAGIRRGFAAVTLFGVCALTFVGAQKAFTQANTIQWSGHGRNPQHTGIAGNSMKTLSRIRWRTPVDLQPQYSGTRLLYHYGSPVITANNTVLVPVKTGQSDLFRIDAFDGHNPTNNITGTLKYSFVTDYEQPPRNWGMPLGPTLSPRGDLYVAGGGGTVLVRNAPDSANGSLTRLAFYGIANYLANPDAYKQHVRIATPITSDRYGTIYFGVWASGSAPGGVTSGIVRIDYKGVATFISVPNAAGDVTQNQVCWNCAPALSNDQRTLYIGTRNGNSNTGYLLALNAVTLQRTGRVALKDVKTPANDALVYPDGTSTPLVGPDGDVYFGVLENSLGSNGYRGWLLHFNSTLTQTKTPGAFGWDCTPAIVPSVAVPSYSGPSKYLIVTKYNRYVQGGNDGNNRMAILDPNVAALESVSGVQTMREVLVKAGPTADSDFPNHPNAVKEWCVNTIAIDPARRSALVNNEDGKVYRWDFTTNQLVEPVTLTNGLGQAYTPTIIGPDGTSYAIGNATLFAVGE